MRFPSCAPATLTAPKALHINRAPAFPTQGDSFDAAINAMADGVGRIEVAPRFPMTYCSQCGGEFGPGNEGFSRCNQHGTEYVKSDVDADALIQGQGFVGGLPA